VTQIPWRRGRCMAWDVNCPTPTLSYMCKPAADSQVRQLQERSLAEFGSGIIMTSVQLTRTSFFSLLKHLACGVNGRRKSSSRSDADSPKSAVIHDRLRSYVNDSAVTVQRGNASCIIGTLQANCN